MIIVGAVIRDFSLIVFVLSSFVLIIQISSRATTQRGAVRISLFLRVNLESGGKSTPLSGLVIRFEFSPGDNFV